MVNKLFYLSLLVVTIGCSENKDQNTPVVNTSDESEKLMQTSREWSASAGTRDADKTLSYWADDAIVIQPYHPVMSGKNAIRQMVESGFKDSAFKIQWDPEKAVISENGDMGYLIENSSVTMSDSTGTPKTEYTKSVTIWKKQKDGTWKNVIDVMTPALPPNK